MRTDLQLGISGGRIQLTAESPLQQKTDHKLSGRANHQANAEVPAENWTLAVGHSDVQMASIGGEGAGEAEDLQIAMKRCGFGRSR